MAANAVGNLTMKQLLATLNGSLQCFPIQARNVGDRDGLRVCCRPLVGDAANGLLDHLSSFGVTRILKPQRLVRRRFAVIESHPSRRLASDAPFRLEPKGK